MRKFILVLLFVVTALLNANIKVLEQTSERIIIKFDIKDFSISESKNFTFVNIQDWTTEAVPGTPDLPFKTLNVAIPPNGKIKTRIISKNIEKQTLYKTLSPVPRIQRGGRTFEYIYEIDAELYAKRISEHVQILEETRYRYYSIIPVRISPFLYDSNTKELTFCDRMVLQIDIEGDTSFRNEIQDKFDFIYKDFILNYETSKYWRTKQIKQINKIPFEKSDFWYRFEVEQNGLYKLTFEELSQLPSFCEPDSIRILTMYRKIINNDPQNYEFELIEVPAFVDAGNDGSFDEEDNVCFFKENYEDPGLPIYYNKKIYWLTFGGYYKNKPLRIEDFLNKDSAIPVENFQRKKITEPPSREDIDAIIIYPEENVFQTQSEELESFHPELNFELKSQEDIFGEYGQEDPFSIKQYLNDKFDDHPELMYVILMGSGTSEWGLQIEKNKIIVYVDFYLRANDDYFVDFNGDYYPELVIGRLPAQNESDMDFLIERIRKYIEEPVPGFWRNCVLILADDEHKSGSIEGCSYGSGLNHSARAQDAEDALNNGVYVDKVMAIEYNFDEYQNKPGAREAMVTKINEGRLVWYYIGHGNEDVLGDEDYFRGSVHMQLLDNIDHLPLFIAASCEVGRFDDPAFDCIAEKLLFLDNGGSIASIAATRGCSGGQNTTLIKKYLETSIDDRENIGRSLFYAKLNSGASITNSKLYNILGDPIILVTQPEIIGSISGIPDSLRAREIASINGCFGTSNFINEIGEIRAFESEYDIFYTNFHDTLIFSVDYTKNGNPFYYGGMEVSVGSYSAEFIVPDDIHAGDKGRIINYVFDYSQNTDFLNYYYPMKLSQIPIDATSTGPPQVQIWLDSKKFVEGDYVSTDPLLMADIEDENGINILGSAGHKILLLLDDTMEPVDVTKGFVYNISSYTKGELTWQLTDLSEGRHTLQLIVFDNFNTPTVAQTSFISKRSGEVAIEQMLPYPNPMEKDGYFTFVITEDSDIIVMIYTITGKKIRTLKEPNCSAGYNQVYWDGKDGDGDKIANNTYFYKVKAKQLSNGKATEKIGKVIILK